MATDIFGYQNNIKTSGQVASTEFAAVTIGSRQSLVQSVNGSYQQQISTVMQVGDPQIYWIPGRPSGTLSIGKLVGSGGFFDSWKGLECGKITNMAIALNGGRCGFTSAGNITFNGGIIQNVSVNLGVGEMTIAESCTIMVANMTA